MNKYSNSYRETVSLHGLTNHILKNYCTYIRTYLDYLTSILHKLPEGVPWDELRDYIRWLQKSRSLSDRTISDAISQLRFSTLYILHKSWDSTQSPMRRFDEYPPYVPSRGEAWQFISSMPNLGQKTIITIMYSSGFRIGEACRLRYRDVDRKNIRLHISHDKSRSARYAVLSEVASDLLAPYWSEYGRPMGCLFPKQHGGDKSIDTFFLLKHIHAHEDRLGWEHRITYHSFRHTFETYLYGDGVDLLIIKTLTGCRSLTSATIYMRFAANRTPSAVNPFNRLADVCHE